MSRDEVHLRDRLLLLAECSNPRLPLNVKRKSTLAKQGSKSGSTKMSMQDFVRMDPGYTPDIEHLVFPGRKRNNPQQVAPINPPSSKTRSRLAEMFALSRHLQQRSADREAKSRNLFNRSMDSAMEARPAPPPAGSRSTDNSRRWVAVAEEPVRQNSGGSRLSPAAESDMAAARGPNVSVLHLRSTSEPWETSPTSVFTTPITSNVSRPYMTTRSAGAPPLTKHQSLGSAPSQYKWSTSSNFHSGGEINSTEIFLSSGGGTTCRRELSPVRWCDREVDGVYLGRSGWVQVQQRSLDENRRIFPPNSTSLQSRRVGMKLGTYHCNSEPGKGPPETTTGKTTQEPPRPAFLSLQTREFDRVKNKSPSPKPPDNFSPPSLTPIISPPPAFQDRNNKKPARSFFGKTPFLPRSPAIVDSDVSPPPSPTPKWKSSSMPTPQSRTKKQEPQQQPAPPAQPQPAVSEQNIQRAYGRIPQTKSMEDTTVKRTQFGQRYGESSSSSSSSMGFRSLDSCVNRPVMPRLSENTDSSIDVYEDADEEDNNSSSLNTPAFNATVFANVFNEFNTLRREELRTKEKISPGDRSNRFGRTQIRKSPAGSDTNKSNCRSPGSSSTSSNEHLPSRSPMGSTQQIRRPTPSRQFPTKLPPQEDSSLQRVRRSRSLQLPDRKPIVQALGYGREPSAPLRISPNQHPAESSTQTVAAGQHRPGIKMGTSVDRSIKRPQFQSGFVDEDMMREAEVVTGFLYGNRSRAAAQALLMHRYNNNLNPAKDEKTKDFPKPSNNGLTVYFVGNRKEQQQEQQQQQQQQQQQRQQKVLHRGATTPNLPSGGAKHIFGPQETKNPCNPETCDFWPHCAHRESLNREAFTMRSSQSYPTHQRSLDVGYEEQYTTTRQHEDQTAGRGAAAAVRRAEVREFSDRKDLRRLSPNKGEGATGAVHAEKKTSPVVAASSNSSSSSDVWLTTSDRTVSKSPKNANKSSGASTPLEDMPGLDARAREVILTRPGSAPTEEHRTSAGFLESQQRSMSLPKSFLSAGTYQPLQHQHQQQQQQQQQGGQFPWRRRGTESLGSSPGLPRKGAANSTETSHTAPVTPLHEGGRRRSPLGGPCGGSVSGGGVRRTKAASTPQLLDERSRSVDNRKWIEKTEHSNETRHNPSAKDLGSRRNLSGNTTESVLQKFRKTFSLRFQKKCSKDGCGSDVGEALAEILGEPSEEESPQHVPSGSIDSKDEQPEQRSRFGPLIWRSSKERKKLNKAARSAKCNSGDSGIQIEMVSGCGGAGDSSESHDTDPPGDDLDSPPSVRRRTPQGKSSRPHSDLLNQILIDKFKSDLKQRAHRHNQVRRTRSDLGGQRLLHWDPRSSYRRHMSSTDALQWRRGGSHLKRSPPDASGVVLRHHGHRSGQLRRSLSQPIDIDKLSPLMRTKTAGLRSEGSHILSEDEHDGRIGTSDDEVMSDSESSIASLSERKKSLELATDEEMMVLAEAVFDHVAIDYDELPFNAGDVIEVVDTVNREWWYGICNNRMGWFPPQFVRLRVSQEDTVEDCLAAMASGNTVPSQIRRRTSISLLSNDQVRTSVVRELIHTERDFVKVLRDVAEGYMAECRKRKDMFTPEQISTIFINLEEILQFQSGFLKDLETQINWDTPHKSCVGGCFLKHKIGFKMYSVYCNSHPMATAKLQELYQFSNYRKFFEACRLMRGLIEIPLDGYLLTPVQRICKYPLQLAELLKYTKQDHSDYNDIKEALEAMRGVAVLINERKRRMESLEKLAAWQQRVEGWRGPDLIDMSSQLIHQGEVIKVSTGMWTNNMTLFLFDHQIVICKKDILKRNTYVYKSRMWTEHCEVIDVPDGKDFGVSVKHAINLSTEFSSADSQGPFTILFCCRTASEKQQWLQAFAEERKFVVQDKDNGLEFPASARQLARMAARCQRRPPRKIRKSKSYKREPSYMGSALQLNANAQNSNSLGRRMGTWFTFGGNKKSRHQPREIS